MERHATSSKTILSAKKSHERCERKRSLKTWIKMFKLFTCRYHLGSKLTRFHVNSDEEFNYKSWLLRIAIDLLMGWKSIVIEKSKKCMTWLEMSRCKISTLLRYLDYIYLFIIIVFFRRPKIFFFWPNWIEL